MSSTRLFRRLAALLLVVALAASLRPTPVVAQDEGLFAKAAAGNVVGGLAGALAGGLILGSTGEGLAAAGLAVIGGTAGFAFASGLGAARAVSNDEYSVSKSKAIGTSVLATAVGIGAFVLIGDAFDPEDHSQEADYSSWTIGAVVGSVLQIAITAGTISKDAKNGRADARSGMSVRPTFDGNRVGATLTWRR